MGNDYPRVPGHEIAGVVDKLGEGLGMYKYNANQSRKLILSERKLWVEGGTKSWCRLAWRSLQLL